MRSMHPQRAVRAAVASTTASAAAAPAEVREPAEFRMVQTRRTFEEVTLQVRELLFGGTLRTGDRLPAERDLSKRLGVGRPALREALRALEVAGLIELRKGKTGGAFISAGKQSVVSDSMSDLLRLGNVSVEELFEAREWILTALVRAACKRINSKELEALAANIVQAEKLHAEGKFDERININFEFHHMLVNATRNPVAVMMVRGLSDALRSLIREVGTELSRGFFTHRRDLLKALASRDEDAAASAMTRIVRATEQTYKRLAQERRESLESLPRADADIRVAAPQAAPATKKPVATKRVQKTTPKQRTL